MPTPSHPPPLPKTIQPPKNKLYLAIQCDGWLQTRAPRACRHCRTGARHQNFQCWSGSHRIAFSFHLLRVLWSWQTRRSPRVPI
jgi:hypothetical protein